MRRMTMTLALLAILGPTLAAPADDEHPIAEMVKAKLKDPNKSFTLGVRLKVKEGAGGKLEAAFADAGKLTRKEKGCLAYDLNRSTDDESQYVIYERWANLAALQAHLKS